MASDTEIANRALTKLGAARVLTLADDTESARVISSMWDIVRDSELRKRNWNFSITRASLARLTSTPSWGYDYEYQLPSDCLRVIQVDQYFVGYSLSNYIGSSEAMYQIEGQKILTDLTAPLKVRYIARIETTSQWDSMFVEAFACRLAAEACERLTQSTSKREAAMVEYKQAIQEATRTDAVENPPEPLADNAWMLSRL